nr:MAG TPA: hypothetical protein [Caudoviricetes sp.]
MLNRGNKQHNNSEMIQNFSSLPKIIQESNSETLNFQILHKVKLRRTILSLSKATLLKIRMRSTVKTEVVQPHNMLQTNSLILMRDWTKADLRIQMRESEFKREQLSKQEDQIMR